MCENPAENEEHLKEYSLFDLDSKDSGFHEEYPEEKGPHRALASPLADDEHSVCFSISATPENQTPTQLRYSKKKRLFISPTELESPSVEAASKLKRLCLFEIDARNATNHIKVPDTSSQTEYLNEAPLDNESVCTESSFLDECDILDLSCELEDENERTLIGLQESKKSYVSNTLNETLKLQVKNIASNIDEKFLNLLNKDISDQFNGTPTTASPIQDSIIKHLQRKRVLQTNNSLNILDTPKEKVIKDAVEKSESNDDLIGDFSKNYALPLVDGSHPDLKCISVKTVKDLLEGEFIGKVDSFRIIDSRYPYEFEGGHIRGALNIYLKEECVKLLNEVLPRNERHILVFHCEFSKERGPNMIRHLRKEDRVKNSSNYPKLIYPEVYLLEGGYKRFFESFPQHCEPREYMTMLDPRFSELMRFFKKQCKTYETSGSVRKTSSKKGVRRFLSNQLF